MSGIRLEDLPAGRLRTAAIAAIARAELEHQAAAAPAQRSRPAARADDAARSSSRGRLGYRCAECAHHETAYKAAERHADTERHCRIELELEAVQ